MPDIALATDRIFDRVHKTGEEIKNDLPNWIELVIESKTWQDAVNPATCQPFADVGQWLIANYPYGPGMGSGRYAITYDELIVLCEDRPKLKDLLIRNRPKSKGGRPTKAAPNTDTEKSNPVKRTQGNSRIYIEERLQREFPKVWKDYLAGKFKSARQAGIKAGFIKAAPSGLAQIKAMWAKLNAKDRAAFKRWAK